jgi:hypothetical protein
MLMRGSPVSDSGRRWSEMDFGRYSANFVIDETFDLLAVLYKTKISYE